MLTISNCINEQKIQNVVGSNQIVRFSGLTLSVIFSCMTAFREDYLGERHARWAFLTLVSLQMVWAAQCAQLLAVKCAEFLPTRSSDEANPLPVRLSPISPSYMAGIVLLDLYVFYLLMVTVNTLITDAPQLVGGDAMVQALGGYFGGLASTVFRPATIYLFVYAFSDVLRCYRSADARDDKKRVVPSGFSTRLYVPLLGLPVFLALMSLFIALALLLSSCADCNHAIVSASWQFFMSALIGTYGAYQLLVSRCQGYSRPLSVSSWIVVLFSVASALVSFCLSMAGLYDNRFWGSRSDILEAPGTFLSSCLFFVTQIFSLLTLNAVTSPVSWQRYGKDAVFNLYNNWATLRAQRAGELELTTVLLPPTADTDPNYTPPDVSTAICCC